MHGYDSFFVADAGGANKTTIKRGVAADTWEIGTLAPIHTTALHGIAAAMADALGQVLTGSPAPSQYRDRWQVPGGFPVTFAAGVIADNTDDGVTIAAAPAWSRSKCQAFIAAVSVYAPLP